MLIEAKQLTLTLGGHPVLTGVDLVMDGGEIYGLLGPNGAGKTTTISVLTGLRKAASGRVSVLGLDPAREPTQLRRAVGVMPEQSGYYDWMTAQDYLRWFASLYGVNMAPDQTRSHLAQVGLDADNRRPIGTYSRGMRQRLGLARALVHQPRLLILDEPTNGLDPRGRRAIHDALLELAQRRGVGILLCTHLLDDVDRLCTRVGIIDHGRIVLEGRLAQLLATRRAASRYRLRLATRQPDSELPKGLNVVAHDGQWLRVDVDGDIPAAAMWAELFTRGWNIAEIHVEGNGLEDLYLAVTEQRQAA
jgi:ABC-2 type transport system ATP-binding protein